MCKDLFFELQKRDSLNEKTIVFCVRDNHSEFVTRELNNLYAQYAKENSLNLIDNFAFNCTMSQVKDFLPDFKSSKKIFYSLHIDCYQQVRYSIFKKHRFFYI